MTRISYQLYCSRNFPPLGDTLKMLAETGFKEVEGFGGLFDDLDGLKAGLDATGLKMTSSHFGLDMVEDDADKTIAIAKDLGIEKVIVPFLMPGDRPTDAAGWAAFGARLAEAGKPLQDAGLVFGWHNHDFEFKKNADGIVPIDYLLENVDPKLLNFQMDLYWVTKAEANPIAYFNKYPGRFKIWHVKDMDDKGRFAPVGKGTINFKNILDNKKLSGMKYYMVEQDMTFDGLKPLDAIKISHDGIEEIGFK